PSPSGRSRTWPCAGGSARPPLRAPRWRSDCALALAPDDLERDLAVPVDERLHRLEIELGGHGEVGDDVLELGLADALGERVELLALLALGLVVADPALERVRDALGRQAHLEPR